jgi:hypothetical protein
VAIVQAAWMATAAIGQQPHLIESSSTNANLPISLGVPAITFGGPEGESGDDSARGQGIPAHDEFAHEGLEAAAPVDGGGLVQLLRIGVEEAGQHPGREDGDGRAVPEVQSLVGRGAGCDRW